jgi:hypothetical protein
MQVKRIVSNISAENVAAASRSRSLRIGDLVAEPEGSCRQGMFMTAAYGTQPTTLAGAQIWSAF